MHFGHNSAKIQLQILKHVYYLFLAVRGTSLLRRLAISIDLTSHGKRGFFICGRPKCFVAKKFWFSKNYGGSARTSVRVYEIFFRTKGEEPIFCGFVRTSFMNSPLSKICEIFVIWINNKLQYLSLAITYYLHVMFYKIVDMLIDNCLLRILWLSWRHNMAYINCKNWIDLCSEVLKLIIYDLKNILKVC